MCFVRARHTRSGFSRKRKGTRLGVCEDFPLPAGVCVVVSRSLESANTSQLLSLLRMRARASEPS